MAKIVGLVLLVLVLFVGFAGCNGYNQLVGAQESVDAAWAQVENVYQRRADLVPNLVATVKGAADFEQETLTAVIEARAKATQVTLSPDMLSDPQALQRFQAAQGELGSALSRLLVTVERYPELRATQNFRDLQSQLEGTENRIAVERRKFNNVARNYNTKIRRLPASLIAGMAGFDRKAYFESDEGASQAPAVEF